MTLFANHAHVFPPAVRPDGTIDRLLRLLDACEIDQAVCFAPFPKQVDAGFDRNGWLAREIAGRPRLRGFGTVDIHGADLPGQVRQIADLGLNGIKLHPNVQEFDLIGAQAFAVYEAAARANLFITFHSGIHHYRLKHYNVLNFDEVAWHFPDLRFSLEHVGGYHFFPEALAVITNNIPFPPVPGKRCRVYAGLTSIFTPDYNRLWYMPRERLVELILQAGAAQCIFGLDFPYNLEEATHLGIQTIRSLRLSPADEALILGGNLAEALGMQF